MKKKIHKIWGVGLTLVLAASLLLAAAPVSAGTLSWGTETIPSSTGNVLVNALDVADLTVADDGTMYLVTGADNFCYKSTNGGASWSKLTKDIGAPLSFVAVAPDDSDMVAVFDGTNVWVSSNGGSTWGVLTAVSAGGNVLGTLYDLAISNTDGSVNYLGVAGQTTGGSTNATAFDVWWFKLGATAPAWKETALKAGIGFALGVNTFAATLAFSPNVASDKTMVSISVDPAADVYYQMFSLSTEAWSTPFGSGYPVELQNASTSIASVATAAVALAPDFLGSDDAMRVAFVGLNTSTAEAGIYRLKDTSMKDIYDGSGKDIHSIGYDGTNLVAGNSANTKVYRSSDSLASSPNFSTTSELKRPGTVLSATDNNKTIVAWRGADVVAGTSGAAATAFAISRDDGKSFNDVSFVDVAGTNLGAIDDVAVSADGSAIYMLSSDANALSLWRSASSWERVFSTAVATGYIVRTAPDDSDIVYLARTGFKNVYYSQAGGDTKWFTRTSKELVQDLAVESTDIAYVAVSAANTVSKTTNGGFTWGTAESTGITGNIYMIRSLGEDKVIVGGDSGYVAWSTDGNDSWSKVNKQLDGATNIQVTASGLADGDYIYAGGDTAGKKIERWEIGQSGTSWKDLSAPTTGNLTYGIALVDGVLYVAMDDATNADHNLFRTISPDSSEPSSGMWSIKESDGERFIRTPQALKVSSGSTKLWAADTATPSLFSYTDTLGEAGPTLSSPRDGATVEMNPVSGAAYSVAFTWDRPSKGKIYDLQVATDSGFNEKIVNATTASTTASTPGVVVIAGTFMPDTTYYWRVRVNIAGPVRSPWSETRTFTVAELPEAAAPIVIQQPPAPVIEVPPAPAITIQPPEIVLPPSPAPVPPPEIVIPPAPAPAPAIPGWALWAIIIIGAVLVIALIVLIMRTRRPI